MMVHRIMCWILLELSKKPLQTHGFCVSCSRSCGFSPLEGKDRNKTILETLFFETCKIGYGTRFFYERKFKSKWENCIKDYIVPLSI